MKRVELAIEIHAPTSDIWAVLTAPSRYPEWITGIQSVEILTDGEYDVGTRYHVTAGTGERTVEWTVEITGLAVGERIDFSLSGDVEGTGGWLIEPLETDELDGGFWVTSFDEFAPPGNWLVKFISNLWPDNAARSARTEALERLKELIEAEQEYEKEDE